jgi:hypothetical protein
VELDRGSRDLVVVDEVRTAGPHDCRLSLHLGPAVEVQLDGRRALLRWAGHDDVQEAVVELPSALRWSVHRGEVDPPLGWYSPGFGRKVPAPALVGLGRATAGTTTFRTALRFGPRSTGEMTAP